MNPINAALERRWMTKAKGKEYCLRNHIDLVAAGLCIDFDTKESKYRIMSIITDETPPEDEVPPKVLDAGLLEAEETCPPEALRATGLVTSGDQVEIYDDLDSEPEAPNQPLAEPAEEPVSEPANEPAEPKPSRMVREVLLCVAGLPGAASAEGYAADLSRKLKIPVEIRCPSTGELFLIVQPKTKKQVRDEHLANSPRQPRQPRTEKTAPDGIIAQMIELASRPCGVTRPQLADLATGKSQPWTTMLKKAAERWGYDYSADRPKGAANTTYRLLSKQELAEAAD